MITLEEQLDRSGVIIHTNKGTSMLPLLRENRDLMVIRKKGTADLHKYDAVLYLRDNGEYVLHRIIKVNSDSYRVIGDNCINGEDVHDDQVLGVLEEIVRNGKTIKVTDKGYQVFVRVWWLIYPIRVLLKTIPKAPLSLFRQDHPNGNKANRRGKVSQKTTDVR